MCGVSGRPRTPGPRGISGQRPRETPCIQHPLFRRRSCALLSGDHVDRFKTGKRARRSCFVSFRLVAVGARPDCFFRQNRPTTRLKLSAKPYRRLPLEAHSQHGKAQECPLSHARLFSSHLELPRVESAPPHWKIFRWENCSLHPIFTPTWGNTPALHFCCRTCCR